MSAKSSTDKTRGAVVTRFLEDGIVETVYQGHINAAMAEEVKTDLIRCLQKYSGAHWLIDAAEATGIEPAKEDSRFAVFRAFEQYGGGRIAVVVRNAGLRMMSATFSFAFGLKMKSFESRREALDYLRGLKK